MTNRLILVGATCVLIGCGLTVDYSPPDDGGDAAAGDAATGDGSVDMDAGSDAGVVDAGVVDAGDDAGTDALVCVDEDGDGFDSCTDCDDSNPDVYPAAPLICGDGIINDCPGGSGDESVCVGIGTFVSETTGSDANPGTRALPTQTVHAGINNAATIGLGVDVYVAYGTYREAITMVEGASVLCGYEPSGWARDPNSYVSDITMTTNGGLLFPASTTRDTMIEGCTLRGRGGVSSSRVIGFMGGSDGIARDNVIHAGDNSSGRSTGVLVYTEAETMGFPRTDNVSGLPLIDGNTIYMGISNNGWGSSSQSAGITSFNTQVEILGNSVLLANHITIQFGINIIDSLAGTLVEDNRIRGTGITDLALTLRVISGYADVNHNDVHPGRCRQACIAAEIGGDLEVVRLANNVFIGGDTSGGRSAGIWFDFERPPPSRIEVLIHSNFLAGGASGSPSVGLGWFSPAGSTVAIGRVINNIVRAGGGSQGYAMYESDAAIDPVLLEHNAFYAPGVGVSATPRLYYDEGGTVLGTTSQINGLMQNVGTSLVDDCGVIDPLPDGDYHLGSGSRCIDAGSSTQLPMVDYEYESRPRGGAPDIGPDEAG